MGAKTLNDDDKAALGRWFEAFQGFEIPAEALYDPTRGATGVGATVKAAARDLAFDTEPARFLELLHGLAPDDAKPETGRD